MSSVGIVAASSLGRIGYLVANSAGVQAVGAALVTVLLGWAATLFANRKRVAWRAYLDAPINLVPSQIRSLSSRLTFRVYVGEPGSMAHQSEVPVPWLAVLRVRNSGFVPIRGSDFHTPLTFDFPGREVRGAEVFEAAGDSGQGILPPEDAPVSIDPPVPPGAGLGAQRHAIRPLQEDRAARLAGRRPDRRRPAAGRRARRPAGEH